MFVFNPEPTVSAEADGPEPLVRSVERVRFFFLFFFYKELCKKKHFERFSVLSSHCLVHLRLIRHPQRPLKALLSQLLRLRMMERERPALYVSNLGPHLVNIVWPRCDVATCLASHVLTAG